MSLPGKALDTKVTVSPQISESDVAAIAKAGFRTIIANRPDGEDAGQADHQRIEAMAKQHGLRFHFIPVTTITLGPSHVEAFAAAVTESDGPVFAYCRSGARCSILWAMSTAKSGALTVDEIMGKAQTAGYDLSNLRPALTRLAEGEG